MHGLHGVADSSFADQLSRANAWLEGSSGGLLVGDFNRVACKCWRNSLSYTQAATMLSFVVGYAVLACNVIARFVQTTVGRAGSWQVDVISPDWIRLEVQLVLVGSTPASDLVKTLDDGTWMLSHLWMWLLGEAVCCLPWRRELMSDHAMYFSSAVERFALVGDKREGSALLARGPLTQECRDAYSVGTRRGCFKKGIRELASRQPVLLPDRVPRRSPRPSSIWRCSLPYDRGRGGSSCTEARDGQGTVLGVAQETGLRASVSAIASISR